MHTHTHTHTHTHSHSHTIHSLYHFAKFLNHGTYIFQGLSVFAQVFSPVIAASGPHVIPLQPTLILTAAAIDVSLKAQTYLPNSDPS